jgi:hypothetical protein
MVVTGAKESLVCLFQLLVLDKRAEIHGHLSALLTMVLELIYKGHRGILYFLLQPTQNQIIAQKSDI